MQLLSLAELEKLKYQIWIILQMVDSGLITPVIAEKKTRKYYAFDFKEVKKLYSKYKPNSRYLSTYLFLHRPLQLDRNKKGLGHGFILKFAAAVKPEYKNKVYYHTDYLCELKKYDDLLFAGDVPHYNSRWNRVKDGTFSHYNYATLFFPDIYLYPPSYYFNIKY